MAVGVDDIVIGSGLLVGSAWLGVGLRRTGHKFLAVVAILFCGVAAEVLLVEAIAGHVLGLVEPAPGSRPPLTLGIGIVGCIGVFVLVPSDDDATFGSFLKTSVTKPFTVARQRREDRKIQRFQDLEATAADQLEAGIESFEAGDYEASIEAFDQGLEAGRTAIDMDVVHTRSNLSRDIDQLEELRAAAAEDPPDPSYDALWESAQEALEAGEAYQPYGECDKADLTDARDHLEDAIAAVGDLDALTNQVGIDEPREMDRIRSRARNRIDPIDTRLERLDAVQTARSKLSEARAAAEDSEEGFDGSTVDDALGDALENLERAAEAEIPSDDGTEIEQVWDEVSEFVANQESRIQDGADDPDTGSTTVLERYRLLREAIREAVDIGEKTDLDTSALAEIRSNIDDEIERMELDATRAEVDEVENRARSLLDDADGYRAAGEYDTAIETYKEAHALLGDALEIAREGGLETAASNLEDDRADLKSTIDTVRDERAAATVATMRERLDEQVTAGEDARDDADYERAIAAYDEALSICRDAIETAHERSLDVTGTLESRQDSLAAQREKAILNRIAAQVSALDNEVDDGRVSEEVVAQYRSLLDEVQEVTVDETRERQLAALEESVQQGLVTARTAVGRDRIEQGVEAYDAEEYDRAEDRFEGALSYLEETLETAKELGFEDAQAELESLIDRCEDHAMAASNAVLGIDDGDTSLGGPASGSGVGGEIAVTESKDGREFAGATTQSVDDAVINALDIEYDDIEIGEPIGTGGNADVYRATVPAGEDTVTVAVKQPRMSGTLHAADVEQLLEEARNWSKLDDHDHIVSVLDYGSEPLPWIAMEYMDGGSLGDWAGQLTSEQTLWTAIAVSKGVRHAHRRASVAHLDLKPENVLFQSVEDGWDVPKVADWGLSKHLLDHSQSVEGLSPHYAAPEQFDDSYGPTDDITDVYQLGAVFYELFTGQQPFEGSPTKVMNAVLNEEPTPPSNIADVPTGLDDVLLTAMAKDRDDRFEDVLLLRNALQNL